MCMRSDAFCGMVETESNGSRALFGRVWKLQCAVCVLSVGPQEHFGGDIGEGDG